MKPCPQTKKPIPLSHLQGSSPVALNPQPSAFAKNHCKLQRNRWPVAVNKMAHFSVKDDTNSRILVNVNEVQSLHGAERSDALALGFKAQATLHLLLGRFPTIPQCGFHDCFLLLEAP
jgi:hypothetical protein